MISWSMAWRIMIAPILAINSDGESVDSDSEAGQN